MAMLNIARILEKCPDGVKAIRSFSANLHRRIIEGGGSERLVRHASHRLAIFLLS